MKKAYLRPYDDPIVLHTTTRTPDEHFRLFGGVHGTVKELLTHLHTSVVVGRRERAEAIVARLAEQCGAGSPELTYAHNAFLTEMHRRMATEREGSSGAKKLLIEMQRWFELEVRGKGVQPDERMLVTMIRASIKALAGSSRLDRSIRRYAQIAESLGDERVYDVLESEDYSDHEFTMVGRATSEYWEEPFAEPEAVNASRDAPAVIRSGNQVDLESLPLLLSTEQRGMGLANVKSVMNALAELPPLPEDASEEAHRLRDHERQQLLEEKAVDVAVTAWRSAHDDLRKIGIHTSMQTKPMAALMWQWYEAMLASVKEEISACQKELKVIRERANEERAMYGPYLELLKPETIAANTVLHTITAFLGTKNRGSERWEFETKVNALTLGIASVLEQEWKAQYSISSPGSSNFQKKQARGQKKRRAKIASRKGALSLANLPTSETGNKARAEASSIGTGEWPVVVRAKIGSLLLQKLIECATMPVTREHPRTGERITQMQPALLHRLKYHKGKRIGIVLPNAALVEKLQSEPLGSLVAKRMPMLVEPKPWSGWDEGGYFHYATPILRIPKGDKSGKDYFMAADEANDMSNVYKGLNALGKVPWKINADVFKVQLEAWNSGEAIANFAPLHPDSEIPPEPSQSDDPNVRRQWLNTIREIQNRTTGLHSQRCFQNFQMEIARTMINETLYFPHNLDFRGRAYPVPPYLNHMGADNVRGVLTFAEGKELGERGLRWLKIHMATVAGYDKASLDDRVKFTMEHLDDIRDSAQNPLNGRRWWLQAEDGWQTLAACIELTKALDSPDPTKYVAHLPVQQDGTCNGLQHYAALGGDPVGARQVNLEPSDKPADVYTAVAEAVKEEVRKDAAAGHPVAQKLDGRITRKCVKQPVMTNVYGVTFYGAKLQVLKQLDGIFGPDTNEEIKNSQMALYVAEKIFKSLGTMFTGAQAIQKWLGQCAERISTALTPEQVEMLISQSDRDAKEKAAAEAKSDEAILDGDLDDLPKPKSKAKSMATRAKVQAKRVARTTTMASKGLASDTNTFRLSKHLFKSTVVWTTPLGLPVVQPYRSATARQVRTAMQSLSIQEPQVWDPVNKRKQLQAFPPNFIHSLDSTHMLLSALKCAELGVTFASVHDSFWTHAGDVDTLGEVLRDAFISMHSDDIVARLREEFQTRYRGSYQLVAVPGGTPLAQKIDDFRREARADPSRPLDLMAEVERMRLLNSHDPEDRARGEAMVTLASIVQAHGGANVVQPTPETAAQGLGAMPDSIDAAADVDAAASDVDAAEAAAGFPTNTDADFDAEAPSATAEADDSAATDAEPVKKAKKTKSTMQDRFVWVPIEFPPVPERGSFDVTKIQQSKYFFH